MHELNMSVREVRKEMSQGRTQPAMWTCKMKSKLWEEITVGSRL